MKRQLNGSFSVTVARPMGRAYQFRHVLTGNSWQSDPAADGRHPTICADAENAVVSA